MRSRFCKVIAEVRISKMTQKVKCTFKETLSDTLRCLFKPDACCVVSVLKNVLTRVTTAEILCVLFLLFKSLIFN